MNTKVHFIFSVLGVLLLITSCFKREEYPVEPVISNPVFAFSGDSARLTFDFTDGDGDLGLALGDTIAPFDPNSFFHYNLYLDYFEKDDVNGWQRGIDLEGNPISFKYRIKPIEIKGRARGIRGTIDVDIINFANPFSDQSDTIRYEIKLIDKALNESNQIETEDIFL